MNPALIFKTSLTAFCVTILGVAAFLLFVDSYAPEVYLLLGFLVNTLWAGAYVYQNSTEHKAEQAVITLFAVPTVFVLLVIFYALISTLPGSGNGGFD